MITFPQDTNLDTLPDDILKEVVPYLAADNINDIISLGLVCKKLRDSIDEMDPIFQPFLIRLKAIENALTVKKDKINPTPSLEHQGEKAIATRLMRFNQALPKIAKKQWDEILVLLQLVLKNKDESGKVPLATFVDTLKSFNKPIAQLSSLEERFIILEAVRKAIIKAENETDSDNIPVFNGKNTAQSHKTQTERAFLPGLNEKKGKGKGLKKMILTRAPQEKPLMIVKTSSQTSHSSNLTTTSSPETMGMDIDKKVDEAKDKEPKM